MPDRHQSGSRVRGFKSRRPDGLSNSLGTVWDHVPSGLPLDGVRIRVDGHIIVSTSASGTGIVSYLVRLSRLRLAARSYVVKLAGMLLTQIAEIRVQ